MDTTTPAMPTLEQVAHALVETARYYEEMLATDTGANALERLKMLHDTAFMHQGIAVIAGNTEEIRAWQDVRSSLDAARAYVPEDEDATCANCSNTVAEMRAAHGRFVERQIDRSPKYPDTRATWTPLPGIRLPDGTYYCWLCSYQVAYTRLTAQLLPNLPDLLTLFTPSTAKGDPTL